MGTFKTFIFGAAFGAGLAFVALQYHVIQSQDGFRVIARTPQHSLGLAYADVRHWDAEQWADRPELAKALIADGSTDIVAGTVGSGVIESVSSEGGTLDQLRSFLNESPADRSTTESLFDGPGITIPSPSRTDANDNSIFSVPFPDEAKRRTLETARRESTSGDSTVAGVKKPSIDDIYSASVDRLSRGIASSTSGNSNGLPTSSNQPAMTPARETELLEDMLFGDDELEDESGSNDDNDGGFGVFEDVTSSLQDRADEVLDRAREGVQNETTRALSDSVGTANRFIRNKVEESLPSSVSNMFSEDIGGSVIRPNAESNLPEALKALRNGFDPFVD